MANKFLKSRFRLRYDTYANWTATNPTLLEGEVAVVEVPSGVSMPVNSGGVSTYATGAPDILFKVGPGAFNDLKFASGLAANVIGPALSSAAFAEAIANLLGFTSWAWEDATSIIVDLNSFLADENGGDSLLTKIESGEITLEEYIKDVTEAAYGMDALKQLVDTLNGDVNTAGSVKKQISDAIEPISQSIGDRNSLTTSNKVIVPAINEVYGDLGNVDDLSTTNKKVVNAINEVLAAVGTGGTAAVVTLEKSNDGLTYTIKQGSTLVGTINIPKDMVVQSGEIVTNPSGQPEGTYIKLTLANVSEPLYINVGTLVDIYRAKANASQVQVAIDSASREISATIVAGSVSSTELADNSVITSKIANNNVTKDKLSTSVQESLDKADSALQEIADNSIVTSKIANNNVTKDKLEVSVQTSLGKADSALQSMTTTENSGFKLTKTNNDIVLDWDEEVIFVFNGGYANGYTKPQS